MLDSPEMIHQILLSARIVIDFAHNEVSQQLGLSQNCFNALALGKTLLTNRKSQYLGSLSGSITTYSTISGNTQKHHQISL